MKKEHECGPECSHNEDSQAKMMEINMLEGKLKQLEQSLTFLDQQIMEQQLLQLNLDEMKKIKNQEMLFPLGKNVFVRGKIESPEVLINVGGNVIIKKDSEKAKETVERQKLQIASVREEIAREIEKIISRISMIERSMQ